MALACHLLVTRSRRLLGRRQKCDRVVFKLDLSAAAAALKKFTPAIGTATGQTLDENISRSLSHTGCGRGGLPSLSNFLCFTGRRTRARSPVPPSPGALEYYSHIQIFNADRRHGLQPPPLPPLTPAPMQPKPK